MKRAVLISLIGATVLFADLTTNVQNQQSKQHQMRKSDQKSLQSQKSFTDNKSIGNEKSVSKNLTKSFNSIKSLQKSISYNQSDGWGVTINFASYFLKELRKQHYNRKAFFLTNRDLGMTDYITAESDRWGSIYNLGKKEAMELEATYRHGLDKRKTKKVAKYINLLYNTGNIIKNAILQLRSQKVSFDNVRELSRQALSKAKRSTRRERLRIRGCNYGGNTNSVVCNSGEYTIELTNSIPKLYVNGNIWYSAYEIAGMKPTLTLNFSKNNSEAMSKLEQMQSTRSVAKMIRDYTQRLKQKGQTRIAQQIESRFIEDTLSNGKTKSVNSVVNAINSGSPIAVLNIFK